MKACLFAAVVLALLSLPVAAYFIYTHPIEDVLPGASHMVLVTPPKKDGVCKVVRIYRGKLDGTTLKIHDVPAELFFAVQAPELVASPHAEPVKPVGVIVALYELNGRFHVVGRRPPHRVTPHSSTWLVDKDDRVYAFRQSMSPGSPVPVKAKPEKLAEFEKQLRELLVEHPFRGADHAQLPDDSRDEFLAITDPVIDWYTRRTRPNGVAGSDCASAGRKLKAFAADTSPFMVLQVFDALQLLCGRRHLEDEYEAELMQLMIEHLKRHGVKPHAELILREFDEGPYSGRDRSALLIVVKSVDSDLYKRSCQVLFALAKRNHHNEGVGAYSALKRNGEEELCEEIKKVWDAAGD